MSPDDLKEFLDANAEDIKAAVRAKMIDRLLADYQWDITGEIRTAVQEFVSAEIVPEVKKYLADQKGPILKAAIAGAAEIGDSIAKAVTERAAKNIGADSYQFREIMRALFQ